VAELAPQAQTLYFHQLHLAAAVVAQLVVKALVEAMVVLVAVAQVIIAVQMVALQHLRDKVTMAVLGQVLVLTAQAEAAARVL
jgi:hypothetical protein